jgi:hypothetical protein
MSVLTGILLKFKSLCAAIANKIKDLAGRLTQGKLPEKLHGKERIILGCAAAVIVALVLIGLVTMMSRPRNKNRITPVLSGPERSLIPPSDLFLPEEPDFLPGVLLERERRTAWTAEDAAAYWQDPLRNGEEPWRQHIEKAIDELMERVP